jgi:TRAP-type C4-dicarboxylate transport system permease small subunit
MPSSTSAVKRIINGYYKILQVLVTILMGLMVIPVTLQIFSRYTGFIPRYIWTEEAARFCFIWIIMTGATIAVRDGTHFDVDILPKPKTTRWQAIAQLIVTGGMMFMAATFLLYGYEYAAFGYRQTSELTGINMVFIHGVYLMAGVSWTVFLVERSLAAVALLRGGRHDAR